MQESGRREMLRALTLAGVWLGTAPLQAFAASCAALGRRQVRWIVPYSPGGGHDTYSRLISPFFARQIGAEVIVENIPGAGSIVGALRIKNAPPDGGTIGIVNAAALLVAGLIGEQTAINLMTDFTVLGRAAHNQQVWATGGRSTLRTTDDVFERAKAGPVVFAVDEVTTPAFVGAVLVASLLGLDIAFVSGFAGSRESTMAAVRGDVDLVSVNFDSIRDRIESGDLRPLLQISAAPIAEHPSLAGVPLLGGETGLAARTATRSGGNASAAVTDAAAVEGILAPGRLIVAPRGLPAAVFACLEEGLHAAAADPEFVKVASKAERAVEFARAAATVEELRGVEQHASRFLPIIRQAVEKARR